ncbi:MAG: SPOR domain-containing protein [Candidatus Omnitrophota bacterium]|jgi:hypothetical protein
MDDKKFVQKELFDDFVSEAKRASSKGLFEKKPKFSINLCLEHITFVFIGFIILSAIVFSIGVEKGKLLPSMRMETRQAPGLDDKCEHGEREDLIEPVQEGVKAREDITLPIGSALEEAFSFTIQIASYAREDTASKQASKLNVQGNEAFVLKKGNYYIVCVGKFKDKSSADMQAKKVRRIYADCIPRKI